MNAVETGGRLHFGLLNPEGASASARAFGGVGLMIAQPRLRLVVEPASAWSAEGPLAERALAFAQRFHDHCCWEERRTAFPPHRLRIEHALPEHAGLGSGTQLGLSVARALAQSWGMSCDLQTLARRVGRGLRSALGAYGFEQGGLLVEAGKCSADRLAPLVARLDFPPDWRIVVILPAAVAGLHGSHETEAFAQLAVAPGQAGRCDALCRLVLLGLLPALVERDVDAFGEALYEFNVRVGEAFAPVQGGTYAGPRVAELVAFLHSQNVRGVGQSSWGPAVFAVVGDDGQATHLAARLRQRFAAEGAVVWVTAARNHGATMSSVPG